MLEQLWLLLSWGCKTSGSLFCLMAMHVAEKPPSSRRVRRAVTEPAALTEGAEHSKPPISGSNTAHRKAGRAKGPAAFYRGEKRELGGRCLSPAPCFAPDTGRKCFLSVLQNRFSSEGQCSNIKESFRLLGHLGPF